MARRKSTTYRAKPAGGKRRFPRGHDYSPSNIKTYRMCPKRLWFQKVLKLYDPAGPEAHVGTVYHAVMERAALARINGSDDVPDVATLDELLGYHSELAQGQAPWVIEESRKKIEALGDADMEHVYESEQPITHPTGRWKFGGILDRIDVRQGEDGLVYVREVDYKTGYIPDYEEFLEDPQVVLYTKWGWDTFSKRYGESSLVLQIAFEWPTLEFALEATYVDGWIVAGEQRVEIASELRRIEAEVDEIKSWSKDKPGKANAGSVHCSYCPYRDQCEEYQDHIRKPARVHPWRSLVEKARLRDQEEGTDGSYMREAVGELLAYRYQWAGDAKVLEGARKEIDRFLIDNKFVVTPAQGERFDDGAIEAYVRRDSTSSYPISVVAHMARVAGVPLEEAVKYCCTVKNSGVESFVKKHPKAAKVAEAYKTTGLKSPWVRVKHKGGLF